ncbi:aminopeptidase N [Terrarubrum flagellatum]|uniref:aminopeptidase N n=1 Tax=Terrirubrum flagellatum TaxID=2895980 RepID=UPI00314549E8
MDRQTPQVIRLADYRPPAFLIDRVNLDIRLHATKTRIIAELHIRANPTSSGAGSLILDGDELNFVTARLDGAPLAPDDYQATPSSFTLRAPPARPFKLEIETTVDPTANTKLMGLYRSGGAYCTQCEADGFRRIAYFLDRPDILSVYTTRIEADRKEAPLLLGNGNPGEAGVCEGGERHYAVWSDPWPKPCYLFALVAGDLASVHQPFVTKSGRKVTLGLHVEKGKEDRCGWAMDSLVRCMQWDERVFGREYDLDVFNVVAVPDFNMGAMENKGLNIFNDKYVLADKDTAADADYANIEAIIAHEYFHNWTGNRITCRDWFQLCLKEGLTVFRDQEFSSDERSRPIKRIADVIRLRSAQFVEDAGPLAHPVRPSQYREINNFYTATVYEKGAEIIRMLKTLVGDDAFARGMDLYFERHDGEAATVEQFIACFAEAAGRDLTQFFRWYDQAGTPLVSARGEYDAAARTYTLRLTQATAPTPNQDVKQPVVIPVALGLVAQDGATIEIATDDPDYAHGVLALTRESQTLVVKNVATPPIPSLFRQFSAPVKLEIDLADADLVTLLRHDTDSFNRWQAAQQLAIRTLKRDVVALRQGQTPAGETPLADALASIIEGEARRDPAFAAYLLAMPRDNDIAREIGHDIDPDAIHAARSRLRSTLAARLAPILSGLVADAPATNLYSPDAASAGRRALRHAALYAAADVREPAALAQVEAFYEQADNLTDRQAALIALHDKPGETRERLFEAFEARYHTEPLVLDKWMALQATIPERETLARVRRLMAHPVFSLSTPNRVYALIMSFAQGNPREFHRPDGEGHRFIADLILELDARNPQVASRLATSFRTWKSLESGRRGSARTQLERLAGAGALSRDVADIVTRTLG